MAFKEVADLGCETTIQLGGRDKKTGKPNPKILEGYYLGFRETTSKFGPAKLHVFQTATGNVGVWGKTDLDRKLATIEAGLMTRATFTGTVPSKKGNDMLKYKVEADDENRIDVASISTPETGDQDPELEDPSTYEADEETEADVDSDDTLPDERPVARPTPPPSRAAPPSATRQAQVQALLKAGAKAGKVA